VRHAKVSFPFPYAKRFYCMTHPSFLHITCGGLLNRLVATLLDLLVFSLLLDGYKMILATYRTSQKNNIDAVFTTVNYSIVVAKETVEPALAFVITNPFYTLQKLLQ
jgi:hypothetical protein